MPALDSAHCRQLCGRFATGVVVITAMGPDGAPEGMTANSFASVSLEPPLISINVARGADMHAILSAAPEFVVNVLQSDQEALSRRFAERSGPRFDGVGFHRSERGGILLDGVIAYIECLRMAHFDAGDHTIFVGQVIGGRVHEGRPLLYYRGGYLTLGGS